MSAATDAGSALLSLLIFVVGNSDEPDKNRRWKMAERPHCATVYQHLPACAGLTQAADGEERERLRFANGGYRLLASPNGIDWQTLVNKTGIIGDTSTIYRVPFPGRPRWVFSIKAVTLTSTPEQGQPPAPEIGVLDRYRLYHEAEDLFNEKTATWTPSEPLPHLVSDALDPPWLGTTKPIPSRHIAGPYDGLYNFDSIAYESVMVGIFTIYRCKSGPAKGNKYNALLCPDTGLDGASLANHSEFDSIFLGFVSDPTSARVL